MSHETYVKAKDRILKELPTFMWEVHTIDRNTGRVLKFPWAKKDNHRLDFRAQAVYLDGHSLFIDIRALSCTRFVAHVDAAIDAVKAGLVTR